MSITKKNTVAIPYRTEYVLLSDIFLFRRYGGNKAEIILKDESAWNRFYSTPGSIKFSQKGGQNPAGPYYDVTLSQFYPGTDQASENKLLQLEHEKMIIKVVFSDQTVRIVGNPEAPARIVTDAGSEASKAGTSIVTNVRSPEKSLFLDEIPGRV